MTTPRKPKNHELNERIEKLESQLGKVHAELDIFRRPLIARDETVSLDRFMAAFGIKDKRTAVKALESLGLPTDPHGGIIFVNGDSLFENTRSKEGASSCDDRKSNRQGPSGT